MGGVGEEQRATTSPTQAREPAEFPGWYPSPSKAPSRPRGSSEQKREAGESRRGRQEGPSGTREAGEERRAFGPPT